MLESSFHDNASRGGRERVGAAQGWNEQQFRTLIENSSDIFSLIDVQGTILYKSPSVTRVLGFEPEELVGHSAFEVAHPEDREQLLALFQNLLTHPEKTLTGEFRHVHKDGTYRWVEGVASNLLADPDIRAIVFSFRDISQRKRIESLLEQKLQQLEAAKEDLDEQNRALMASRTELEFERCRYLELFNFAPDGYVVTDLGGLIQEANLAACRMLRQTATFLRQLPLLQFFQTEDRSALRELLARFRRGPVERSESIEGRLRAAAGEPVVCSLMINAVPGPEPETVVGLRWLIRDITPFKRTEHALREREGHLRVLTETMPAVPWSATPEGAIDYFSDKWLAWTGLTREQALGYGWQRAVHPQDLPRVEAAVTHSMHSGEPFDVEHRLRRPGGGFRWYRSRALPQRDDRGRIVRWYGITDDIHELKMAMEAVCHNEEQLRQSQQRLRLALGSAAMGFYERDALANQAVYDAQCRAILGLPEGVSSPEAARKLIHPEDRPRVLAAIQHALDPALREVASGEFRIIRPDGQMRWVAASGRVLFDDRFQPARPLTLMGVVQDITERKLAEEQLRQSQQRQSVLLAQVQAANRELDSFASVVSHDLRQPLRGVATIASWLEEDYGAKLDAKGREHLLRLSKCVQQMSEMIKDILEYSRAGPRQEEARPVPLAELVASVVEDLAPPPNVRVELAPDLPVVPGEPVRLRQVFQNLIDNAIKYGDKALVLVRVGWFDAGEWWELSVADNGPGIEARHFERIFEMFQTLAPRETTDSTGVGLALVKRIVEYAGGRVWVESRLGEGSTFHFSWPKRFGVPAFKPEAPGQRKAA